MNTQFTSYHYDLAHFQLRIAQQWFDRGENRADDVYAQFFFYYAAFNAIFFLWKKVDGVSDGDTPQIESLLARLGDTVWKELEDHFTKHIGFFAERRHPIEDMRHRRPSDASRGKPTGRGYQEVLANRSADATKRLKALGNILYLVRGNLTHGSKMDMGDDFDIIKNAVPLLRLLSSQAIQYTKDTFGQP